MSNLFVRICLILSTTLLLIGCGSAKRSENLLKTNALLDPTWEENHFVGLLVVDPVKKDTLYQINSKKYFIPASTTKIFTLYTALHLLPDRIPVLNYIKKNDSIFFEGTGDPTQLHPYFNDNTLIEFLKEQKNLVWHTNNYRGDLLGPGWAWEDYGYYYQVERGALPLYGNVVSIYQNRGLQVAPQHFKKDVIDLKYASNRELESNTFFYDASRKYTVQIPFRTDSTLTKKLLEEVVKRPIHTKASMPDGKKLTLYGVSTDSVYRKMMHESDNFLAEQLLILSSGMLFDTLDGNKTMEYMLKNELSDLKQVPRWVDGSGLSRYNLFTPESMVQVLGKLKNEVSKERLYTFFVPYGSQTSTSSKVTDNSPYIYAKSGSFGNNYSLNGYIETKSGKLLIFSFMNNHFTKPSKEIRSQVQRVLQHIYDKY